MVARGGTGAAGRTICCISGALATKLPTPSASGPADAIRMAFSIRSRLASWFRYSVAVVPVGSVRFCRVTIGGGVGVDCATRSTAAIPCASAGGKNPLSRKNDKSTFSIPGLIKGVGAGCVTAGVTGALARSTALPPKASAGGASMRGGGGINSIGVTSKPIARRLKKSGWNSVGATSSSPSANLLFVWALKLSTSVETGLGKVGTIPFTGMLRSSSARATAGLL